jgi:CheY-like chemotaxis protein
MTQPPILHVEDEEFDVLFLRRAFLSAGVPNPIEVARDGQEAIEYLSGTGEFADRARFPLPCLVILDLKMPRRNGMDVLKWLRGQSGLACTTVIVFSSSGHEGDVERAYQLGANSYVVKPADVPEREEFARAVKDYWLRFHEFLPMASLDIRPSLPLAEDAQSSPG